MGGALKWNRFPAFCAFLTGGATVIPVLTEVIFNFVLKRRGSAETYKLSPHSVRLLRFTATLISALICFPILNSKRRPESRPNELRKTREEAQGSLHCDEAANGQFHPPQNRSEFAGRTLDLTLFATTRAVDALVNIIWARWKETHGSRGKKSRLQTVLPQLADSGVFAASAAIVMWAWFYLPERLPYSYGRWIGEAAQVDERLINALRGARRGEWTYGQDKGSLVVLETMCEDYGWPIIWGDTSKTVPIPCEMVHMGCGPNCERHAVWRFIKTFKFACSTYMPLQLIIRGRSGSAKAIFNAVKSSIRSSTFLGLFVSLFYYSVCLARTRLGPKLVSAKRISPMTWDSGLCVLAGCIMCGWSILVETPQRRPEFALFVAPRAGATLFPRRYDRKVCLVPLWHWLALANISPTCSISGRRISPSLSALL